MCAFKLSTCSASLFLLLWSCDSWKFLAARRQVSEFSLFILILIAITNVSLTQSPAYLPTGQLYLSRDENKSGLRNRKCHSRRLLNGSVKQKSVIVIREFLKIATPFCVVPRYAASRPLLFLIAHGTRPFRGVKTASSLAMANESLSASLRAEHFLFTVRTAALEREIHEQFLYSRDSSLISMKSC